MRPAGRQAAEQNPLELSSLKRRPRIDPAASERYRTGLRCARVACVGPSAASSVPVMRKTRFLVSAGPTGASLLFVACRSTSELGGGLDPGKQGEASVSAAPRRMSAPECSLSCKCILPERPARIKGDGASSKSETQSLEQPFRPLPAAGMASVCPSPIPDRPQAGATAQGRRSGDCGRRSPGSPRAGPQGGSRARGPA